MSNVAVAPAILPAGARVRSKVTVAVPLPDFSSFAMGGTSLVVLRSAAKTTCAAGVGAAVGVAVGATVGAAVGLGARGAAARGEQERRGAERRDETFHSVTPRGLSRQYAYLAGSDVPRRTDGRGPLRVPFREACFLIGYFFTSWPRTIPPPCSVEWTLK